MRDSLAAGWQLSHSRWDPVSQAALRFPHSLVRSFYLRFYLNRAFGQNFARALLSRRRLALAVHLLGRLIKP